MEKIIPDLLVALQDLQNKNRREVVEALADLSNEEQNLMVQQVERLYKILDIENRITFGTRVNNGYVAGIRRWDGKAYQVLVTGKQSNEWWPIELVTKTS